MLTRTRMIVITRRKITKGTSLLLLVCIFVFMCVWIAKGNSLYAFCDYENILNSQIVPAKGPEETENKKKSKQEQILQHFFALSEHSKVEIKEEISEEISEPMLQSESITIDKGIKVSNATKYAVTPQEYIGKPLSFDINDSGPQVLIMHTHTTESFAEESYIKGAPDRNLDETKNITAVGDAMVKVFLENGIEALHDKTVHDYPSYNSSYQSADATIRKNLNNHPGIKVVLDIHRDGITREDGTKVKMVADVNGEKTAQIMLVVGTDTNLPHENWRENFKFASKIQAKAEHFYPSLMRPIDLRKERFNEQLTLGSLIIEVGSNGNTMEEAIRGGQRIAEILSIVLKEG